MKINETSLVKDILNIYPETLDVFLVNGFNYGSRDELIEAVGESTMLKTVLSVKNINPELFIFHLEEIILKTSGEREYLLSDFNDEDTLDFYGNTICPLKFTFRDNLERMIKENYEKTGEMLNCYLEAGKRAQDVCDEVLLNREIDNFPNILFSKEFNQYLSRDFREKMMGKDYFNGNLYKSVNKEIEEAGIIDPLGEYAVYAVMADVFLVDMDRLGDLPVPETLEDLLNPIYRDQIVIFGKQKKEFSNATFLYVNKKYGEEGLKKLSNNVKCALHGAQMSKVAGTNASDAGSIYLVSWFFAKTCSKKNVKIIWPKDGAMTLPMYMLIKKDNEKRVKDIVDYVIGDEFAEHCIKANTPVVNGNVDNKLPEGAKFSWLGWDYIRENDISSLEAKNEEIFMKKWEEYHKGQEIFR